MSEQVASARPSPQRPAIIYCRVSTPNQEREGTSLESQEAACSAFAAAHGYAVERVIREVGSAAELWERPLLTQARELVKAPRREVRPALIIYDLDRLARNPIHQAIVIEECMRAGVALEIVLTPLDSSPEGMLIAYVRGYAAQIEREKIRERQMRGKRQRALNGQIHRSGPELYGYRRDLNAGVRLVYEPEARIVRLIFAWCADEHLGVLAIARRLTEMGLPPPSAGKLTYPDPARQPHWGKSQLLKMLRNPAYKGEAIAWRTRRPASRAEREQPDFNPSEARIIRPESEWIHLPDGVTPALVTPELWQRAQETLRDSQARQVSRNLARFYLLRGLVACGRCGRRMEANIETGSPGATNPRRVSIYRCSSRNTPSGPCGSKRIRADLLEEWVWERVAALIHDPAMALAQLATQGAGEGAGEGDAAAAPESSLRRERANAQRAIERLDSAQAHLLARYTASLEREFSIPWELVEREVGRLEAEKRRERETMAGLDARLAQRQLDHEQAVTAQERLAQLRPLIDAMTPQMRREVLEALDARIIGEGRAWRLHIAYPLEAGGEWVTGVEFTT